MTAQDTVESRASQGPAALDERILGAGTTQRFVLLLLLFVAGSVATTGSIVNDLFHIADGRWLSCALADGYDPSGSYQSQMLYVISSEHDRTMAACAESSTDVPYWLPLAATAVLVAAAYGLYRLLPVWKGRSARVVPLAEADVNGTLEPMLDALVATAGLATCPPRIVVDPSATTASAVVFGTRSSATVRLDGGLLVRLSTEPERFRAVVLHELAHIRNGDIAVTYATVALWRVFLAAVLLPHTVLLVRSAIPDNNIPTSIGYTAVGTLGVAQAVLIVVLVYLARADILRRRELYADLAAARWGAEREAWLPNGTWRAHGPSRRAQAWASFRELWRTHPSWTLRSRSLTDPSALFALGALPMFITGATSDLASTQLGNYSLGGIVSSSDLSHSVRSLLIAGLIAAITVVALWRAVVHAVLTGRRVPSGWRAGLGLGAGLALCELTDLTLTGTKWLPAHPEALLIFVAMAVALTVWTTQYAELRIRTASGRSLRPSMAAGFLAFWLVLALVLTWWYDEGFLLSNGWPWSAVSQLATIGLRGLPTAHPDQILQIATVLIALPGIFEQSLRGLWWAVPLLWLLPAFAWARQPPIRAAQWLAQALPAHTDPPPLAAHLPRMGRILRTGLVGGLAGCVGLLAVRAYTGTQRRLFTTAWGAYELRFITWVIIAICGAAILTSVAVALRGQRRFALLTALIAGAVASMIGLAFHCTLATVDGCLGPLNVQSTQCAWRPAQALNNGLMMAVGDVLCLGVLIAALAAAAISAARSLRSGTPPGHHPPADVEDGDVARRLVHWRVATAAVAAVAIAAIASTYYRPPHNPANVSAATTAQNGPAPDVPVGGSTPTAVAAIQLQAWQAVGGHHLAGSLVSAEQAFYNAFGAVSDAPEADAMTVFNAKIPPTCTELSRATRNAEAFFPVPIAAGQKLWSKTIKQFRIFAAACDTAVKQQATGASLGTLTTAHNDAADAGSAYIVWLTRCVEGC
ncbi:M56 family metallopeptidase [Streptomyces sp. NPDC094438]|uniref:M56 family metallopeptidase n=1 Tax=Streptomyces sp. NPDC094438 TaxID=3366061 RepID=UPI00381DE4B7